MQKYQDPVTDQYGNSQRGAVVLIKTAAGETATIYSDNGVTTKTNPITTGADGAVEFYAANGDYVLYVNGISTTEFTLLDVTEASTATPTSSSTVLGETAGVVRRFAVDELVPTVSVFQYMTAAQIADVQSGTALVDVTSAMQTAVDAGVHLICPAGAYKHGPLTMSAACHIEFLRGASVVPSFAAGGTEKLYAVTGDDVTIEGLKVASVTGTISGNKYLVHVTGARCKVRGPNFASITASDGNLGSSNLIVVHGIYLDSGADDALVEDYTCNFISGSAFFAKNANDWTLRDFHLTDTRWYSINVDHDSAGFTIRDGVIDGDDVNTRNWGGSINLMSQTTGNPNKRALVENIKVTGVHNYGAALRLLSCSDLLVDNFYVYDAIGGDLLAGPIQYVALDRRGTAIGEATGGPSKNVTISNGHLKASGAQWAIYIKNGNIATRSPHEEITIRDITIESPDASNYFAGGVWVNGQQAGFRGLKISNVRGTVKTVTGSPVGGGIGFVSTDAEGLIENVSVDAHLRDITASVPADSFQLGVYVAGWVDNIDLSGGSYENFRYGIRTGASNVSNVHGLYENRFTDCLDALLVGTAPVGGGFDMSLGTAIPVTGLYRVGHIRQKTDAAASASWGWVVTTAGGAMTGAWASGATYTAGVWYRNASNRVYELITAGGGTTSVEPTHTTIGQDVTGADGYVWRCRSTTAALWATLPALGAAVALP